METPPPSPEADSLPSSFEALHLGNDDDAVQAGPPAPICCSWCSFGLSSLCGHEQIRCSSSFPAGSSSNMINNGHHDHHLRRSYSFPGSSNTINNGGDHHDHHLRRSSSCPGSSSFINNGHHHYVRSSSFPSSSSFTPVLGLSYYNHVEKRLLPMHYCYPNPLLRRSSARTHLNEVDLKKSRVHSSMYAMYEIMKDVHGSLNFSKVLDACNSSEKEQIVASLVTDASRLIDVAKTNYGADSVMKLITAVQSSPELCNILTSALDLSNLDLMFHSFGHRVVRHRLKELKFEHNMSVFQTALRNFNTLARDAFGSSIIQDCIKRSAIQCEAQLLEAVVNDAIGLAKDPSGNFVLQAVIGMRCPVVDERICSEVAKELVFLSMHKNGSYVIERCLESSAKDLILQALLKCDGTKLAEIAQDRRGNYILQSALKAAEDDHLRNRLIDALSLLRKHPKARHVWMHLSKGSK